MFHDPTLQLHTIARAQHEHREIAARHRLARRAGADRHGGPRVASRRAPRTPTPRRMRSVWRLPVRVG